MPFGKPPTLAQRVAEQTQIEKTDQSAAHLQELHALLERLEGAIGALDPDTKHWQETLNPNQEVLIRYEGRLHYAIHTMDSAGTTIKVQLPHGPSAGVTIVTPGPQWIQMDYPAGTKLYSGDANQHPILVRVSNLLLFPYAVQASVSTIHSSDNQPLPANSQFTTSVSEIINVIGNADRQREAGADAQPSVGIMDSATNLAQTQSSNATGAITAGQTTNAVITPTTMTSGMVTNNEVDIDFGTANQETGYIISATATTITVQPANGSPAAPSWKFNHAGTYKIQVKVYNVARDAKGENSGADGTGTSLALEYEWNSGGPPLASGVPSLDQYDRETLGVGQGKQSQAITATATGNTSITLTVAQATLTPGQPIRLSGGAVAETVYVDQSYVPGSNTVIPLKHPVVNNNQNLATWQIYNLNGPGTATALLYGEGLEGILLNDAGNPGFGVMQQANSDTITLVNAVGATTTQTSPDQSNPNWRGLKVFINVTNAGTGSITVSIRGRDPVSGTYFTILASAAIVANGFTVLSVYPGLASTANVSANDILPRTWDVQSVANNANAMTYTISCALEV